MGAPAGRSDGGYQLPVYPYRRPPELDLAGTVRHRVVIVGGGLAGLSAALDLSLRGVATVLLDEDDTVGALGLSSRGICYAQRTLEIAERFGIAQRMMAKGITWNAGRIYVGDAEIYRFTLQADAGQKHPAFINLQQYYVEEFLVQRLVELGVCDLRWRNRLTAIDARADHSRLTVETPDGAYAIEAEWLLACDGGRSLVRHQLGLDPKDNLFDGRWCIADFRMHEEAASERRFWLNAPFNDGGAAILHQMADGVWRSDFQIGHHEDPALETQPEQAIKRIQGMLGADRSFDLVWSGPWRFKRRLLDDFRFHRVLFVGDAAHEFPPFGARGGNSGVQDAENLAWKLALVLAGQAPEGLIDSYNLERRAGAVENIYQTVRSVLFIGPETAGRKLWRDAVLALAPHHLFARPMVNTGRLSVASVYRASALSTPDRADFAGGPPPGAAALNSKLRWTRGGDTHLLDRLDGRFACLIFVARATDLAPALRPALHALAERFAMTVVLVAREPVPDEDYHVAFDDSDAAFARYDATPGTTYLLRPDSHVAARWRTLDPEALEAALARATGHATEPVAPRPGVERPPVGDAKTLDDAGNDVLFDLLVELNESLAAEHAPIAMAKLVLLLANRVGDIDTVRRAIDDACAGLPRQPRQDPARIE